MNLFVNELSKYLINECTSVLDVGADYTNKITLVVQSLPLAETIAVLKRLDDFFVSKYPGTVRALKISRGLWYSWSVEEREHLTQADVIQREWVDMTIN